jgi:xanthine dehydrogenase/oxidase
MALPSRPSRAWAPSKADFTRCKRGYTRLTAPNAASVHPVKLSTKVVQKTLVESNTSCFGKMCMSTLSSIKKSRDYSTVALTKIVILLQLYIQFRASSGSIIYSYISLPILIPFKLLGMVMSMSSMLRQANEKPELEDVEIALQGNLCRCTGYRPIIEGFRTLCKDGEQKWTPSDNPDMEVKPSDLSGCKAYTKADDPAFPEELKATDSVYSQPLAFTEKSDVPWFKPATLSQLVDIRQKYQNVEFFAGGQGKFKLPTVTSPDAVIQVTHLDALQGVRLESDGAFIGAGTTMAGLHDVCSKLLTSNAEEKTQVFKTFKSVLKTWVTAQVRNVATIGGHILWAHPCSDLIPIFMAARCQLEVLNRAGKKLMVPMDDSFFPAPFQTVLGPGDLILNIKIPFTRKGQVMQYYRRARRKEFDLPIANAAFLGDVSNGKVSKVCIVAGGMEGAFPGARASPAKFIKNTSKYLEEKSSKSINKQQLAENVYDDIFVEERAPGKFSNYRRCLVAVFVERFLNDISGTAEIGSGETRVGMKHHQLFEKPDPNQAPSDPIHRPIPHNWAAEQATGEAVYLNDIGKQGRELQLVMVQSSKASAIIKKIDFSDALKVPGVVGYVTADDIPAKGSRVFGTMTHDEPVMASDEVTYYGQAIAALVCEDIKAGRKAKKLVQVTYEEKESVLSVYQSKNTDDMSKLFSPPIPLSLNQGVKPVGKTVKVEGSVHLGGQEHFYMETQCALVIPTGEKEEMVVHCGTQNPSGLQGEVAKTLGIAKHNVVVKCKRVGGGFGGKERCQIALITAVAAKKFKRPVRAILSRAEDFETSGHRHDLVIDYKAEMDEQGTIVDIDFNCNVNSGSSTDCSVVWVIIFLMRLDGGYGFKNIKTVGRAIKTNTVSNTAMRGFGGPEAVFVVETVMSHLAHKAKMDVNKIKFVNLSKENDMPHYGNTPLKGVTLGECWKECLKLSNFEAKKKAIAEFNAQNKVLKRGITLTPIKFTVSVPIKSMNQGGALVLIYVDGSVLLHHGGVEMGQGLNTKMIQVASHELGIPMEKITTHSTSTDSIPNTTTTGGSTGADFNGAAVIHACKQLNERLDRFKKAMPDKKWEDWVQAAYDDTVSLSALATLVNRQCFSIPPHARQAIPLFCLWCWLHRS